MKRHKLMIDDPDGFLSKIEYDDEDDYEGHITIQEGDIPPRFPRFYFVEIEDDG